MAQGRTASQPGALREPCDIHDRAPESRWWHRDNMQFETAIVSRTPGGQVKSTLFWTRPKRNYWRRLARSVASFLRARQRCLHGLTATRNHTITNGRKQKTFGGLFVGLLALAVAGSSNLSAQDDAGEDAIFELSPFQIDAESDVGYAAQETLAGTRLRTNVRDVGAAMTIMTPEFLEDVGAVSFEEALEFAPNTDTFEAGLINQPDGQTTRGMNVVSVRGFTNSSLSRDFFTSLYRADTYNTERLTFSRGPNSILFGIAQPGGVTNALSKRARFGHVREVSNRLDDHGSVRFTFDYNTPLVEDMLAIRVAGLDYDNRYWREPEFEKGRRGHLALKFMPLAKLDETWQDLDINVSYEGGDTNSQRLGRNEPIYDRVTPWIAAGRPISDRIGNVTNANAVPGTEMLIGRRRIIITENSPIPGSATPILSWRRMARGARPAVADSDQSRRASLLDESIMPHDVNYYAGTRRYSDDFSNFQVILNKSFFNKLHIEAAYNRQAYNRVSIEEVRAPSLDVDPNRFLPNGDDNPNVGRYYLEGAIMRAQPWGQRELTTKRYSASYELDFTANESLVKHLGRLRVAGSLEAADTKLDQQWTVLANVTPTLTNQTLGLTGPSAFPANVRHPHNRIVERFYIDPLNGHLPPTGVTESYPGYPEPLWAGDAIPTNMATATGVTPFWIADFPGFNTITENRSDQVAAQWFFLNDRIVLTYGKRWDEQNSWNAANLIVADTDPVTQLRPDPRPYDPKSDASSRITREGAPETMGIVAYPHRNVGLFYNESDNFVPVGQQFDVFGEIFPNQSGDGKDYGFKFFLLDDRLSGSITWFETSLINQVSGFIRGGARGISTPFNTSSFRLWETVFDATGDEKYNMSPYYFHKTQSFNALQDITSEGVEFQMTWNPTPNWRIMANYSEQEGLLDRVASRMFEYFTEFVPAEMQALEANWASFDARDREGNPVARWQDYPTEGTWPYATGDVDTLGGLVEALDADVRRIRTLEGTSDTRQPLSSFNLVTSYSFDRDSALKGWTVGGTLRWRDDRFIGFPYASDGVSLDAGNPYMGGAETIVDGMVRYRTKLFDEKVDWSIQLNVRNLLDKDDLLPFQTSGDRLGKVVRWSYQTPRSFILTNTFRF